METVCCILIVEDNEVVRDILAVALQDYGYTIAPAATVPEAEAAIQQRGPTVIGLVIVDINLTSDREAREGYALYQRWTTAYPRLAYLLISGDWTNAALPAARPRRVFGRGLIMRRFTSRWVVCCCCARKPRACGLRTSERRQRSRKQKAVLFIEITPLCEGRILP